MHQRFALALVFVAACAATALACGSDTVALIKAVEAVEKMEGPPPFRCGEKFNEMLFFAHKKDWKGALAAYEAHLSVAKRLAASADARETFDYLRRKAQSQKEGVR